MKSDAAFQRAFHLSEPSVLDVAKWMKRLGYHIRIDPQILRPNASVRMGFVDDGDLEITQIVQVKHRSICFTCASDYPYPDVMVDEAYKVDRHSVERLFGYVILNMEKSVACCIRGITRKQWVKRERFDTEAGRTATHYYCPLHLCSFHRIDQ